MKQLKMKEVSAILKKYIFKSGVRPVLQNANITENSVIATDTHQLIRINSDLIEDESLQVKQTYLILKLLNT